jgi:D-alanine transaminase
VIIVDNRTLMTAPEGPRILSGVTREVVLRLARQEGLEVHEQYPSREKLFGAPEVFLTGTTVEVLPVVRIDGKPIGSGEPGPVTRQLAKRFMQQTG